MHTRGPSQHRIRLAEAAFMCMVCMLIDDFGMCITKDEAGAESSEGEEAPGSTIIA